MSSILKALKKLENDKRLAQPDAYRAPRVSLETAARPRRKALWGWLALVVILAGSAGLAGFWLVRPPAEPVPSEALSPTVAPTPQPAPSAEPVAAAGGSKTEGQPPAQVAEPAAAVQTATRLPQQASGGISTSQQLSALQAEQVVEEVRFTESPVPAASNSRPAPVVKAPVVKAPVVKAPVAKAPVAKAPVVKAPVVKAPVVKAPVAAPGDKTLPVVSEIFYQAEGGGSMAVVNDLPVMEGTQVDEALVDQILPDRVRFRIQGALVDVPVGKGR